MEYWSLCYDILDNTDPALVPANQNTPVCGTYKHHPMSAVHHYYKSYRNNCTGRFLLLHLKWTLEKFEIYRLNQEQYGNYVLNETVETFFYLIRSEIHLKTSTEHFVIYIQNTTFQKTVLLLCNSKLSLVFLPNKENRSYRTTPISDLLNSCKDNYINILKTLSLTL